MRLKLLITVSFILGSLIFLPVSTHAFDFFSNTKNPASVCTTTTTSTSNSPVCEAPKDPDNPVIKTIQTATSVVALLAGVLAIIMIIVSGFTLITSAGNQDAVTNSRKRITSAVIGLVIVSLAWLIIRLVTDRIIQ